MSNFIFSLNATLPLFIMIALGYFLKRVNILTEGFLKASTGFNFKVTLPVLLFVDLMNADIKESFNLKFLLFCLIVTSITFWGTWGIAKLVIGNKKYIAEFVQACYRSSAAVMGLAMVTNIYGKATMGGLMLLGCAPLYNVYAVILLQTYALSETSGKKKSGAGTLLLSIAKNPIVLGIVLGLIASLIDIEFPALINTSLNYVSRIATPLALICIGGDFNFTSARNCLTPSVIAAVVKSLLLPVIFVPLAVLMGFRGESLIAIFVMLAGPTTPSAYIMAKQYGNDGTLTASVIVFTTLASIFTLTFFVFILKTLNLI